MFDLDLLPEPWTDLGFGLAGVKGVPQLVAGLPIDAGGSRVISATWPLGLPSGVPSWVQQWIADPAGAFGFSASNALEGALP